MVGISETFGQTSSGNYEQKLQNVTIIRKLCFQVQKTKN